jgi:hypothetical protein
MTSRVVLTTALLTALTANAILPATKEQILCNHAHVVLAQVTHASPFEPRGSAPAQSCDGASSLCACYINVVAEVKQVLGIKNSVMAYPQDVGIGPGKQVQLKSRFEYRSPVPITSDTCAHAAQSLHESEWFLSVTTRYGPTSAGMLLTRPPYWATFWGVESRRWIETILAESNGITCPSSAVVDNRRTTH